jgi:hypothetical protein
MQEEAGKVPMPSRMFTKPVDVNQAHKFGHKAPGKPGISYEPIAWT